MRYKYIPYLYLLGLALAISKEAAAAPCPRFAPGSVVSTPADIYSKKGALSLKLVYDTTTDADGRTLYCFTTAGGAQSPTLHLWPGDRLVIQVRNNLPAPSPASSMQMSTNAAMICGAAEMNASSVNLHYHGTNTSPTCHSDEVIHTLINSGETFTYRVAIPSDQTPGVYWYHPHVHGISEAAVQGGASGAIVVEGIETLRPELAAMPQRLLIVRDQDVAGKPEPGGAIPSWDLSLNYVPIAYPKLIPAVIRTTTDGQEFWRVLNAAADTILDIQVLYDGKPQNLNLIGLDGVPLRSRDGRNGGGLATVQHFRVPPAGRAEFTIRTPSRAIHTAQLVTLAVNTGPAGDSDPARTIANILPGGAAISGPHEGALRLKRPPATAKELGQVPVTASRSLYFSENEKQFFITVEGQQPRAFSPDTPPAVVTTQGAVEEWTIENRTRENHEFHIHQLHFLVLSQDHFQVNGSEPVAVIQGEMVDVIDVPFWDGNPDHPYPSVKVRMDFRGPQTGDFVYHCHILEHEDAGMMAVVRVKPKPSSGAPRR